MSSERSVKQPSVILLTTQLSRGGAETQIVLIATGLKARGWRVDVVSILPPIAHVETLASRGIRVHSLDLRGKVGFVLAMVRLNRLIRQLRPTGLVSFNYHANILGRLCGAWTRVPRNITSLRAETFRSPWRHLVLRLTRPLAHVTNTNSERARDALARHGVARRKDLSVIPNGVDAAPFAAGNAVRATTRAKLGLGSGMFAWLSAGRLEASKDFPTLFSALDRITSGPDFEVLIAGAGSLRSELEQLASKAPVRVRFLGLRADLPEVMAACDGFVLASAWEGLPNVLIEAAASGLVAVATDVGGVREILDDGVTGIVVRPRDPHALAAGMERAMALGETNRAAMGQKAQKMVLQKFDSEAVINDWSRVLRGDLH